MEKRTRLFILAVLILALAATVWLWLPPLLSFTQANSDLIQGLEALLGIGMGLGGLVVGFLGLRSGSSPNIDTGGGDAIGRDQNKVDVKGSLQNSFMAVGRDQVIIVSDRLLSSLKLQAPQDLREAGRTYLTFLYDQHCFLNLKGLGVSDRIPLRLALLDVYIPLRARLELPSGDTWQEEIHLAGRRLPGEEGDEHRHLSEPQPVVDLLRDHAGLVLLGDPGAGKSTFLKYITLQMALGQGVSMGLGERLPVLVPLAGYANRLEQEDVRLDDFIAAYFCQTCGDLPVDGLLSEALSRGRALVLLDGLDEVKRLELRSTVVSRVVTFYNFHRRAGNKFVITSRLVGYREVRPAADDLVEATLVDLEEAEIRSFVEHWTLALEKQAQGVESRAAQREADREQAELLAAIEHNPGVRQLAANPLLLTILAVMKRQGVTLPDRRVELYDQYIKTMLSVWNRARSLSGRTTGPELDVVQTVRVLAPLALWMHETSPGLGLVKREDLRRKLIAIYASRGETDPESAANRFLGDVHDTTSLLLERGPGEYGFIHLTFEEFLAGVAIALQGQGDAQVILAQICPRVTQPTWREPLRLAVAYIALIQQLDRVAGQVLEALAECDRDPEAAILAGETAADLAGTGLSPAILVKIQNRLLEVMTGTASPAQRCAAGNALARLGDPRFRADAWFLPDEPLLGFVEIPFGPFRMGSDPERDKDACEDEQPQQTIHLPAFYIARYPVTTAQYRAFVTESGYATKDLNSLRGVANHPVTDVIWRDAQAYCDWLTAKLCDWSLTPEPLRGLLSAGGRVALPSEAEWEKAARGTDGRLYPWGNEFNPAKANTGESEISGTSSVGCFPGGASPFGIEEMSGNVWEWTRSAHRPYSYTANGGRENSQDHSADRVLRGGSWYALQDGARCAVRLGYLPYGWRDFIGFRVIVLPSSFPNSASSDSLCSPEGKGTAPSPGIDFC